MSKFTKDLDKHSLSLAKSLPKDDVRHRKFRKQRKKRGFDDTETWSLDTTFAQFMAPRLKRYIEVADEVILLENKEELEELQRALDFYGSDKSFEELVKRDKALQTICKLFPKALQGGLWW